MGTGRWLTVALLVVAGGLVGFAPAQDKKPDTPTAEPEPAPKPYESVRHKDIAYRTDKDADPERHKLDVYVPKGKKDFPVLMFVHGGGWKSGSKSWYTSLGHAFAGHGIGTVVTNYRLSPKVKHPAHAEDVAK